MRDAFWLQGMLGGVRASTTACTNSRKWYTEDLKKIDVPALVVHGDDDQIVPFDASAKLSSQIIRDAELKVYAGARTADHYPRRAVQR